MPQPGAVLCDMAVHVVQGMCCVFQMKGPAPTLDPSLGHVLSLRLGGLQVPLAECCEWEAHNDEEIL